jgi:hypothetical protein
MKGRYLFFVVIILLAATPTSSFAVTECTAKVAKIWTGDNGVVWLFFDNGVNAYTPPADPDTKNILAVATGALLAGKTVTIRFQADSLPCDSSTNSRNDIVGVYLNK